MAAPAQAACSGPNTATYYCDDPHGTIPPPPAGYIAPQPPPALAGNGPWDGHSPLTYPAPRPPEVQTPVYQPPAAPAQVYDAPAAPAPANKVPAPAYVQPAAPAFQAAAVSVPKIVESPAASAATEVVQGAPTTTAMPTPVPTPSAAIGASPSSMPTSASTPEVQPIDAQATASHSDAVSPAIVTVAGAVVAVGAVVLVFFLKVGPGISGIRRIARVLLRR